MRPFQLFLAMYSVALAVLLANWIEGGAAAWERHAVDDTSRGADGARLADANGDGRPDIATGWEEGGVVRVYLNPGPENAADPWPMVEVGKVGAPEDAVLADLDGDGAMDVVSCTEGDVKTVWTHWAPSDPGRYMDETAWVTEAFPALQGEQRWMYCLPMQIDGENGIDLVIGSKGSNASVGWLRSPENPRDMSAWRWHPLTPAGWIMSLEAGDMDGDGDLDILYSDRKGALRGCHWLENPGPDGGLGEPWNRHPIGGADVEVMFLDEADFDGDGLLDVIAAAYVKEIVLMKRSNPAGLHWEIHPVPLPETAGIGKAAEAGDIDLDGNPDLVVSCEHAGGKTGVMWFPLSDVTSEGKPRYRDISGLEGTKYDRLELIDLDGDGDLDVLTCEERDNLGVIWYENPAR